MLINLRILPVELGAKEGKDPCGIEEATSTGTVSQLHRISQIRNKQVNWKFRNSFMTEAKTALCTMLCSSFDVWSVSVHHIQP